MGSFAESFFKIGSSCVWVARDLENDPSLRFLADPDALFSSPRCEVVKDQRKIKVGRLPLEIAGGITNIYLKRYNVFSWRYRVGSLFAPSPARRSWMGGEILASAGFHTGRPIAAVECRSWGMLTKGFYLSEEIPGKTVDAFWREDLGELRGPGGLGRRRAFLKELASLFRSLHRLRIYHNDLKDANILVRHGDGRDAGSFYLLDLEGIRRYRHLPRRRRVKNLVQLNRTMGRFLRRTEKLYFLKAYLESAYFDEGERKKWVKKILRRSRRGDRRSLRKMRLSSMGSAPSP